MTFSPFLRRILTLDAASCLAMGAGLTVGASTLSPLFGIDPSLVRGAGVALLPIGLFIGALALRGAGPKALVYLVVAGNLLWAFESLLLVANTPAITGLGTVFVAGQAIAVAGFAALEWLGLRRPAQRAAA